MSCSGLHCSGCAGGMALPVVPLAVICGLAWIAEHIIEVAAVSAACGALAVAAVVALMRMGDRRDARQAAGPSLLRVRAEAIPIVTASPQVSYGTTPPAIEHHYHGPQFIINGEAGQEMAARLIRQALAVPAQEGIRS